MKIFKDFLDYLLIFLRRLKNIINMRDFLDYFFVLVILGRLKNMEIVRDFLDYFFLILLPICIYFSFDKIYYVLKKMVYYLFAIFALIYIFSTLKIIHSYISYVKKKNNIPFLKFLSFKLLDFIDATVEIIDYILDNILNKIYKICPLYIDQIVRIGYILDKEIYYKIFNYLSWTLKILVDAKIISLKIGKKFNYVLEFFKDYVFRISINRGYYKPRKNIKSVSLFLNYYALKIFEFLKRYHYELKNNTDIVCLKIYLYVSNNRIFFLNYFFIIPFFIFILFILKLKFKKIYYGLEKIIYYLSYILFTIFILFFIF